ncbi:MAG: metal-dependent hydrolase [Bacteroidota bacterium]
MDSFTQIALGAAVGEAVAGRKLGNKALLFGAIAGTIPDLDVFIGKLMHTVDAIDFHRGISHSIVFALLISPLLALILQPIYKKTTATFKDWFLLFFLGFVTHALLDAFTTWGTQLFWPLDYRAAFKSIFVIDPLYTLPLTICLVWLAFLSKSSKKRRRLNKVGLTISTVYLLSTVAIKLYVNTVFEETFAKQQLTINRYETRPAPLNTVLWAANAESEEGFYVGYYSLFDKNKDIDFFYFPKNEHLIAPYQKYEKVQLLMNISNQWFNIQPHPEGIVFNDLRFGQRTGWTNKDGDFVFSYLISYDSEGNLQIQEMEKDFSDGKALMSALGKRLMGNKE